MSSGAERPYVGQAAGELGSHRRPERERAGPTPSQGLVPDSNSALPQAERTLTLREAEVLSWIATGKSDWQVGQILEISAKTVNFHVENAKRKFGVATRMQAVVRAMQRGALSNRPIED